MRSGKAAFWNTEFKLTKRKIYWGEKKKEKVYFCHISPRNSIAESRRWGGGGTVNGHQDGRLAFHLVIRHRVADVAGNG